MVHFPIWRIEKFEQPIREIHILNGWHLHFCKTYAQPIPIAGRSRGVYSLETNQANTGDVITLKPRCFIKKAINSFNQGLW